MVARGPQNGWRGQEGCLLLVFGRSDQLSLNKFFDPSTPFMRKGRDGGETEKKKEEKEKWNNYSLVAEQLERRPLVPII